MNRLIPPSYNETGGAIMNGMAALARRAIGIGDVVLYRQIEATAFCWCCAEGEWSREFYIEMFPWGLDL